MIALKNAHRRLGRPAAAAFRLLRRNSLSASDGLHFSRNETLAAENERPPLDKNFLIPVSPIFHSCSK
jgi:hypothetical protein